MEDLRVQKFYSPLRRLPDTKLDDYSNCKLLGTTTIERKDGKLIKFDGEYFITFNGQYLLKDIQLFES